MGKKNKGGSGYIQISRMESEDFIMNTHVNYNHKEDMNT